MVGLLLAADAFAEAGGHLAWRGVNGPEHHVELESSASRLELTLHADETAGARVDSALLRVAGLMDESGAQVTPLTVKGRDGQVLQELQVGPSGSVPVTLAADLPAPGTYRGTLELLQDGAVQSSLRLVIRRPKSSLNVGVEVAPMRGYTPLLGDRADASLQLNLHEKEGRPVLLFRPVLARLVLATEAPGESGTQVLAEARFVDGQGRALEAPLLLDRRMTLPLRMHLTGLPGPGQYRGTLRVGSADAPALDMPFELSLRERPEFAFLLIAAGVGLSFLIRKYVAHERPRMVLQQQGLKLVRALEAMKAMPELPLRERELVTAVTQEAEAVLADVSGPAGGLDRAGERLTLLERKVACTREWLRLRRAVGALPSECPRAEFQAKLDGLERILREPGATAEALDASEAVLPGLPAELEAALRQHLAGQPKVGTSGPVSFSSPTEQDAHPGAPEAPLQAWLFEGSRLFMPRTEGRPVAESLAQVERRLASLDLVILAVVLGVASLAGLKLLWMDNPTWGSLDDRLLALVWGFGLHQACHPGLMGWLGGPARLPPPADSR